MTIKCTCVSTKCIPCYPVKPQKEDHGLVFFLRPALVGRLFKITRTWWLKRWERPLFKCMFKNQSTLHRFQMKTYYFAPFSKRFASIYSLMISFPILPPLLSSRQIKVVPLRWSLCWSCPEPSRFWRTSTDSFLSSSIIFVPLDKENKKLYDILFSSWKIKKLSQQC